MKKVTPILIIGWICLVCFADAKGQQVVPSDNGSSGLFFSQDGLFIDMSSGEIAVSTIQTGNTIITQGYLQPIGIEQPCSNPQIVYYPNPVINRITIEAVECDFKLGRVEAVDLFGKLALETSAYENSVDLTPIGVGIYILQVFNTEDQFIGSVKIVKISS